MLPTLLAKGRYAGVAVVCGAVPAGLDCDGAANGAAVRGCSGRENTGVIYGWIAAAHQVEASLSALLAGSVRQATGDYAGAFFGAAVLCLLAAGTFGVSRRASVPELA